MSDLKSQVEEHRKAGDLKEFCLNLHERDENDFFSVCKMCLSYAEIKEIIVPMYKTIIEGDRKDENLFERLFTKLRTGTFSDEDDGCAWIKDCDEQLDNVFEERFYDVVLLPNLTVEERKEIKILQHFRLCEEIFADDDSYPGRSEYLEEIYDYCARLAISPDESSNHKLFVYLLSYLDDENREAFDKEIAKRIKAGGNSFSYKHIVI